MFFLSHLKQDYKNEFQKKQDRCASVSFLQRFADKRYLSLSGKIQRKIARERSCFGLRYKKTMLEQININHHNFSKIGKYISNKLHHIKSLKASKSFANLRPLPISKLQDSHPPNLPIKQLAKKKLRKQNPCEPCVGSYRINYSITDKNVHQCNFSKSTPHFHRLIYRLQEVTPLLKDYPQEISPRQKGFHQLSRMVGRQQIKGSIRKNQENPHQNRFQYHQLPFLTQRVSPTVNFCKMSPRKALLTTHRKNAAEYHYNFEFNKKRLDSHIIPFQRQKSRPYLIFQNVQMNQSSVLRQEQINQAVDKSVAWSKQLSRYAEGLLPSYMEKTVTSRMAMQTINFKTLQMNCADIRQHSKIPRKRYGPKEKLENYTQIDRAQ